MATQLAINDDEGHNKKLTTAKVEMKTPITTDKFKFKVPVNGDLLMDEKRKITY